MADERAKPVLTPARLAANRAKAAAKFQATMSGILGQLAAEAAGVGSESGPGA